MAAVERVGVVGLIKGWRNSAGALGHSENHAVRQVFTRQLFLPARELLSPSSQYQHARRRELLGQGDGHGGKAGGMVADLRIEERHGALGPAGVSPLACPRP